jgi:hypothetical protein
LQRDTKTAVGRLRPGDGLKQQVHRRTGAHCLQLRGDMREAARLRRHAVGVDQPGERVQNGAHGFHRVRGRVHSNYGVAASEEESFKRSQQNSANIVHRMIRLHSNPQHAALAHGVPASRYIPDFCGRQNQVFVAHDFCDGRRDFRNDGPLKLLQFFLGRGVVENQFPEFAHGHALNVLKPLRIAGVQKQAADFVVGRVDQRLADNFPQGKIGEFAFCSHTFALRTRGDPRQLIAGFFFVGLGQQVAQIAKNKLLGHGFLTGGTNAKKKVASIANARKPDGCVYGNF